MVVAAGGVWIKRPTLPFVFVLRIALDSAAQNVAFVLAKRIVGRLECPSLAPSVVADSDLRSACPQLPCDC